MTLGPDDKPLLVIIWCPGHPPDGISLRSVQDGEPEHTLELDSTGDLKGTEAKIPIESPPPGWAPKGTPTPLDPSRTYGGYGTDDDGAYSIWIDEFSVSRLRRDVILQREYGSRENVYVNLEELRQSRTCGK